MKTSQRHTNEPTTQPRSWARGPALLCLSPVYRSPSALSGAREEWEEGTEDTERQGGAVDRSTPTFVSPLRCKSIELKLMTDIFNLMCLSKEKTENVLNQNSPFLKIDKPDQNSDVCCYM